MHIEMHIVHELKNITILVAAIQLTTVSSIFPRMNTDPEEDVFGGVEASSVDARGEGRVAVADDPAGEAGDGAGRRRRVLALLGSSRCVRHHEVYGALRGAADLQNTDGSDSDHAAFIWFPGSHFIELGDNIVSFCMRFAIYCIYLCVRG